MAGRFIKLYDKIREWEWYRDVNTFHLFVYLLLSANWTDGRFEGKEIKRGQLATSLPSMSSATGLSIRQTRTALEHLISTGEVTNKSYTKYRVITITNYDLYQDDRQTKRQTNDRQTTDKTADNRQQYKNNINNINNNTTQHIPPTLEEVKKYAAEIGGHVDAEHFIDYYETRGWEVKPGQKMKSWKAELRIWERREVDGGSGKSGRDSGGKGNRSANDGNGKPDYSFLRGTIINL